MKRVIVGVVICALVAGCKKYDEGLAFSLRSKKNRVVNTWQENERLLNGEPVIFPDPPLIELKKDGKIVVTTPRSRFQGTWSFESQKDKLRYTFPTSDEEYEIKRLTRDELWLFSDDGTNSFFISIRA